MEVFDSINYLKEIIKNSKKVPMSEMVIINKYELLETLEMIKKNLPLELEEAKKIIESKNEIFLGANREAAAIVKEAEEYVSKQVNTHEITIKAENAAEELINRARVNARELRIGAREYSSNLLIELEEQLENSQEELIHNLDNSYNAFINKIESSYNNKIQSIKENMEELKRVK